MVSTILATYLIYLKRGHAGMNLFFYCIQYTRINYTCTTNTLNVFGRHDQIS